MLIELTSSGRLAAATIRQAVTDLERRALGSLHAALQALTEVSS